MGKEVKLVSLESEQTVHVDRNSPERLAWKLASSIYPGELQGFAQSGKGGFHNSGNLFEQKFTQLILDENPLQFVGFWGEGRKASPDSKDTDLIGLYMEMQEQIRSVYENGVEIHLIMADLHGQFNGYQDNGYSQEIWQMAEDAGLSPVALSELYYQFGLVLPNPTDDIIESSLAHQQIWNIPKYHRQVNQWIESAGRHNHNGLDPENAAFNYLVMRLNEKDMLRKSFPDAVVLVNGSKSLSKLILPEDMPHMYLNLGPAWFEQGEPIVNY
jgi:hypothetical protein